MHNINKQQLIADRIEFKREAMFASFGKFYAACSGNGFNGEPATLRNYERGQKIPAHEAIPIADTLDMSLDEMLRGPEWNLPDLPNIDLRQDPQLVGAT